jgi:hypothetical protein
MLNDTIMELIMGYMILGGVTKFFLIIWTGENKLINYQWMDTMGILSRCNQ